MEASKGVIFMSDYIAVEEQNVPLNQAATFTASTPCRNSNIYFENGSGVFILRGIVNNPYAPFARYTVKFNGNIAVPEGDTVGAIAVALTVNGEPRPSSVAISTPAAVEEFNNVTSLATVTVPRGASFSVSLRAVAPPTDVNPTPADGVLIRNGNIEIIRVA